MIKYQIYLLIILIKNLLIQKLVKITFYQQIMTLLESIMVEYPQLNAYQIINILYQVHSMEKL